MTQEEYVRSKMTKFDWFCAYSWTLTLAYIIGLMGAMAFNQNVNGNIAGFIFGLLFATLVILRGVILANKVERWKAQWEKLNKFDK